MEIQIKKFNMNKITSDKVVVLIGKRNTGKSYLVKDLISSSKYTCWSSNIWDRGF